MQKVLIILIVLFPVLAAGQLNNHWSQNFNDESSLLAGAVVGGGAGPSAIYYNPATISEINESKLSLNASLFSFDFLRASNAWGEDIDFYDTRSYVTPRFLTYMLKPKNNENWSFEFAFLNVANLSTESMTYVDKKIDILSKSEGEELYSAYSKYSSRYRDDWVGFGGSLKLKEGLHLGGSFFISFLSQYSYYNLQIDARPNISNYMEVDNPYFVATYKDEELAKFNDYRGLMKLGLLYTVDRFSLGINITSPVVSGIYSDGKRIMRRRSQENITDPETGNPINDYLILDYAEKKNVMVKSKTSFSIAAGLTYYNIDKTKILYTTVEYFSRIDPYAIVKANDPEAGTDPGLEPEEYLQWLTFVDGAKSIFNLAVGYKWYVKDNLMLLAGFKSDFNYKKDYDLKPYWPDFTIKSFNINKYHFTWGSTAHIFGQDITAGVQYSIGALKNQKQVANLSEPVEYNSIERKALQGTRQNTMKTLYNSVSIYVAATFNFGSGKKDVDLKE